MPLRKLRCIQASMKSRLLSTSLLELPLITIPLWSTSSSVAQHRPAQGGALETALFGGSPRLG